MTRCFKRRSCYRLARDECGQMTVELCIVFPVAIAIALIVVNAATFLGYCSQFDRVARNAIRVVAASPEGGQTKSDSINRIKNEIASSIGDPNVSCDVTVASDSFGLDKYEATLIYRPTLFGVGINSSVFGVRLPSLSHVSTLVVDPYVPGEIL